MDLKEHAIHTGQQRHPWETTRYEFFSGVLLRKNLLKNSKSVIDMGSGDAWFVSRLAETLSSDSKVIACDNAYTEEVINSLKPSLAKNLQLTTSIPQSFFDLALLLDVLEHIEDDHLTLKTIVTNHIPPQGWLLLSVPAWPQLFSAHDTRLGHFRRYSPGQLENLAKSVGLTVIESGGLFFSLFIFRFLEKIAISLRLKKDILGLENSNNNPSSGGLTRAILRLDAGICGLFSRIGIRIPGLSWWCLCQKP